MSKRKRTWIGVMQHNETNRECVLITGNNAQHAMSKLVERFDLRKKPAKAVIMLDDRGSVATWSGDNKYHKSLAEFGKSTFFSSDGSPRFSTADVVAGTRVSGSKKDKAAAVVAAKLDEIKETSKAKQLELFITETTNQWPPYTLHKDT